MGGFLSVSRASVVLALCLVWAGCRAGPSGGLSHAAVVVVSPSVEVIDSLRVAGDFSSALVAARARQAALSRTPAAQAWMRDDAARLVATVSRLAAAPESVQTRIAHADALTDRADSLNDTGDAEAAMRLIEEQLAIRRQVFGLHHPEVAASLSALADLARHQGEIRRAFDLNHEALAMRRRLLGERHPAVAESFDQLAQTMKGAGTPRGEALAMYRQALAMREEMLGSDDPATLTTQLNMANLYRAWQKPDSALMLFRPLLAHARRLDWAREDFLGDVLFSTAMTLTAKGDWSAAEPLLAEAVPLHRKLGARGRLVLLRSLSAYGTALQHAGHAAAAESVLIESAQLEERMRSNLSTGLNRTSMFSLMSYNMLAAAQLENGHSQAAWVTLERARGRTLLDLLVRRGAVDTTGWWQDALPRVQRALPADAAIVGWLTFRSGASAEEFPFWCYCIRQTGPVRWRRIDGPPGLRPVPRGHVTSSATVTLGSDAPFNRLDIELNAAAAWPLLVPLSEEVRRLGREAYDMRFRPLEPWLVGVKTLVINSPDFSRGAPLDSWVDDRGRWLADRFVMTYAPSALLYARSVSSAAERSEPRAWRALLLGEPGSSVRDGAGATRPSLAAANREVRAIAGLLPSATVLQGPTLGARLRTLVRDRAMNRFDLLHFALHGAGDNLWMGRTALLLSTRGGAAAGGDTVADRLTVDEVGERWHLDADLVTLAACDAGAGPGSPNDGYIGLHHAFLVAGARHVLMSLRPVDDGATALLMQRFYEVLLRGGDAHVEGGGADTFREARALSEARHWLREWRAPDGTTPYAHPTYWAGFLLLSGGCPPQSAARVPRGLRLQAAAD